nr:Gag-Pol polyprotein [Tanacetum cinerariifolium]
MEYQRRREQGELERLKLAQRDKEIELQQKNEDQQGADNEERPNCLIFELLVLQVLIYRDISYRWTRMVLGIRAQWQDKMSRDVITVGSTMRIPLLYRGEYSQWCERFMNYLEEQTDGEAMINSIQNGDQPFPVTAPVSLAGTAQNASSTLKDPNFGLLKRKGLERLIVLQDLC